METAVKPKEQPMLFKTAMVQAIMNDTKFETRRDKKLKEINLDPDNWELVRFDGQFAKFCEKHNFTNERHIKCPWKAGNILWVKETWRPNLQGSQTEPGFFNMLRYKADGADILIPESETQWFEELTADGRYTWQSSMFMRRIFARTFLEITEVRLERLHDIDRNGAIDEGVHREWDGTYYWYQNYNPKNGPTMFKLDPISSYQSLWETINGEGSWDINPYIWVLKFAKLKSYEKTPKI